MLDSWRAHRALLFHIHTRALLDGFRFPIIRTRRGRASERHLGPIKVGRKALILVMAIQPGH